MLILGFTYDDDVHNTNISRSTLEYIHNAHTYLLPGYQDVGCIPAYFGLNLSRSHFNQTTNSYLRHR